MSAGLPDTSKSGAQTASAPDPKNKPPRTWKNLGTRFISAVSLGLICIVPFYFGGLAWVLLVTVFAFVIMREWVRMADPAPTRLAFLIPIIGLALVISLYQLSLAPWGLWAIIAVTIIAGVERIRRGGFYWASFGFLYILIPSLVIIAMRGNVPGFDAPGFGKVFFIILVVAAADTGAYFGGSYFKGPKLFARLSPNKTWSGFFSGLVSGAIIGTILAFFIGFPLQIGALLALPIIIVSVLGDLLESALKRALKVKDTGGVLPGHGGLLDRFDSIMLTIVVVAIVFHFYPFIWPLQT